MQIDTMDDVSEDPQAGRDEERRVQRCAEQRGQTSPSLSGRHLHHNGQSIYFFFKYLSMLTDFMYRFEWTGRHSMALDGSHLHGQFHSELVGLCRSLVAHFFHSR